MPSPPDRLPNGYTTRPAQSNGGPPLPARLRAGRGGNGLRAAGSIWRFQAIPPICFARDSLHLAPPFKVSPGPGKYLKFLRGLKDRQDQTEALEKACGSKLQNIEAVWKSYAARQ